jgi:fucose permease
LLGIAYVGFISLGLPDTLIGVAWPSARDSFRRQQADVALVFLGSGAGYFVSSLLTGRLLDLFKIGWLLALSSALVALSGFGYATAPVWALFAACSLIQGLGSGAIDAGLNHFVAHHFSARHMNWLHAFYSVGAMLGPLLMTAVLATRGSWRTGYFSVAVILLVLSLLFAFTRRHWNDPGNSAATDPNQTARVRAIAALRTPAVWLHVTLFFIYTGLEVTVGQWSFTVLTESRQMAKETAGLWVSAYWASILGGRILFGFLVEGIGIDRLLRGSIAAGVAGAGLFAWNVSTSISALALPVIGLGLASIYPNLMTRTAQRFGQGMAAHVIGFQVSAAMLGAALLPSGAGLLAEKFGLETVPMTAFGMAVVLFALHETLLARTRKNALL